MCLAIPAEVTALLPDGMAKVSLDGVTKTISVALLDEVAVGDYVVAACRPCAGAHRRRRRRGARWRCCAEAAR